MMRCDQCEYWCRGYDDVDTRLNGSLNIGVCDKAVMFWDATEWQDNDQGYFRSLKPDMMQQKSFVQDGSDYKAYLLTTEDFFCAHFKADTDPVQPS